MKLYYNEQELGNVTTNRSLTVKEALYSLGYDLDDPDDMEQAYEDRFPAAFLDDEGNYQIDEENIVMVYDVFNADSFGSNCPKNWEEIADYLNSKLGSGDDPEEIWEAYCNGYYTDAPEAEF